MLLKRITLFTFIFTLFFSCAQTNKEAKNVRDCFNGYKNAILNDKSDAAYSYIDNRTKKYYTEIAQKTRDYDSLALSYISLIDKITILSVRQKAEKEELLNFNGETIFKFAIDNGMVGKNSVVGNTIGSVAVENDFARGQFINDGKPTEIYYHFYKESEKWKIDLTSIFNVAEQAIKAQLKQSGLEESTFIELLLSMVADKPLKEDLWHPVTQ